MAKRNFILPDTELIEVVASKGSKTIAKTMTFGEWLNMKKKPGWYYLAYQIGFRNSNEK